MNMKLFYGSAIFAGVVGLSLIGFGVWVIIKLLAYVGVL